MDDPPTDDLDETTAYRARIVRGVLDAVVEAGAVEGSGGGMINLDIALEGICDAIAMIEHASGVSKTPKQRRELADFCRSRIVKGGSALAKAAEDGQPIGWKFEAIGNTN